MSKLIFVGGAPRTGTTLLHALVCTSPSVNDYVAECSYFSAFLTPYFQAFASWDVHTKYWFESQVDFVDFHTSILHSIIGDMRRRVGSPEILAVKDPLLTPHFHHLAKMFPEARFLVAVRDPRDAILSRMDVAKRMTGEDITPQDIETACIQYNFSYEGLIDHASIFEDRLMFINYNSLVAGTEKDRLIEFGITDIDESRIWQSKNTDVNDYNNDPWYTPLYGQKIKPDSVMRYRNQSDDQWGDAVVHRCGEIANRLGLNLAG